MLSELADMSLDEFVRLALAGEIRPIRLASVITICEAGRTAWFNRLIDEGRMPHTHLGRLGELDDGSIDLLA